MLFWQGPSSMSHLAPFYYQRATANTVPIQRYPTDAGGLDARSFGCFGTWIWETEFVGGGRRTHLYLEDCSNSNG